MDDWAVHKPNVKLKLIFLIWSVAGVIKALGEQMRGKFHIDEPVLTLVGLPTSPTSPTSASASAANNNIQHDSDDNEQIRNLAIR